jgi:hypothetical protein
MVSTGQKWTVSLVAIAARRAESPRRPEEPNGVPWYDCVSVSPTHAA